MKSSSPPPRLTAEEKALLIELEPVLRDVWSTNLQNGSFGEPGKWMERALSLPTKRDTQGKPLKVELKLDTPDEDFFESCCIFRGQHLHTITAVYRILRTLKKKGLLNVSGFDATDARPRSKVIE